MKKQDMKIIVFKESLVQSIFCDIVTFGTIVASFALSHYFVDGNNWLDGLLTVMLVFWLLNEGKQKAREFYSVDDVVKFLSEKDGK